MSRLLIALGLLVLSATTAFTGEIADRAAKADEILASGDAASAYAEFKKAEDAMWAAMPLTIVTVEQVSAATGVGIYTVRSNHIYRPDEQIFLYMEPIGYTYGDDGLGNALIKLGLDLTLFSEAGEKLATVENISSISLSSRKRNREMYFNFHLSLDGGSVDPGKYRAEFTVRDTNSNKTATFSINFEIKA